MNNSRSRYHFDMVLGVGGVNFGAKPNQNPSAMRNKNKDKGRGEIRFRIYDCTFQMIKRSLFHDFKMHMNKRRRSHWSISLTFVPMSAEFKYSDHPYKQFRRAVLRCSQPIPLLREVLKQMATISSNQQRIFVLRKFMANPLELFRMLRNQFNLTLLCICNLF